MAEIKIVYLDPSELTPYAGNAKKHPPEQVEHIANSIKAFGWQQPIVVDKDNVVIIGHGRLMAAKEMGLEKVPVVRAETLTEDQVNALRLADNKTNESEWDMSTLEEELARLAIDGFDMAQFGFEEVENWFDRENRFDTIREEGNDEYNEFLDKFEPKKTTDDCYTPDNIYDAIADWVADRYKVDRSTFVRPFYPGGDYQKQKYPSGCVVVDNPPFSIMAQIIDFYIEHGVRFFLFAPSLACFNYLSRDGITCVAQFSDITYENGARVKTSFLTNMEGEEIAAFGSYELFEAVEAENTRNEEAMHKHLPKYEYPYEVLTSAKMGWLLQYGQELVIRRDESMLIRELDAMKDSGKGIYGNALLLSERAAAERAAAERAAAERASATVWQLSDRERAIVQSLGKWRTDE